MPWSPQHKQKSRQRITDAAARSFRQHGPHGIGLDGVLKGTGLTAGAFYGHFDSKQSLFRTVLRDGLAALSAGVSRFRDGAAEGPWLRRFAAYYLGAGHLADVAGGCALPALSADAARGSVDDRSAYEQGLADVVREMEAGGLSQEQAFVVLALSLGGVVLCRAVASEATSAAIANAITAAVEHVAVHTE